MTILYDQKLAFDLSYNFNRIEKEGMSYSYASKFSSNQLKVRQDQQPLDTVSCIINHNYIQGQFFLTAGWDAVVRLYQIVSNSNQIQKRWEIFLYHPVLSIDVNQNNILFAGLASGNIVAVDMQTSNIAAFGSHDAPVIGTYWLRQKDLLMTLGLDRCIRFWSINQPNKVQAEFSLPLKTVACCLDYPYLMISSVQSTVAIVSLNNLPNLNLPKNENQYQRTNIQRFSKIISCCVSFSGKKGLVGTVDGRCSTFAIRQDNYGQITVFEPIVNRNQKKGESHKVLWGQINCLDIATYNNESFALIGGSEDLATFNLYRKIKCKTITSSTSSIGAVTAVKMSPKLDYVLYATGSDWLKGIHELENPKKPKIGVTRITKPDLNSFTARN